MNPHVCPKQTAKKLFDDAFPDMGDSLIADCFLHMMEKEPAMGLDAGLIKVKDLPPLSLQQQNETATLILLSGITGRIEGLLHADPGDTGGYIQRLINNYKSFNITS